MKRKRSQRDPNYEMPIGEVRIVKDFLPPPSELAKAPRLVRVTIELDWDSIDFFQKQAEKHKTKYQRMIREVLKRYVAHFQAA